MEENDMKKKISTCLSFAEGNGKVTINKAKNSDFPNSLINDEKMLKIYALREQGFSLREIAKKMEFKNQTTILDHLESYKKKTQFYNDWVAFWVFIEPIKIISIDEIAKDIFTEKQLISINKKGINNIGDYLLIAVTMPVRQMQIFLGDTKSDYKIRREKIFQNIKKIIEKGTLTQER